MTPESLSNQIISVAIASPDPDVWHCKLMLLMHGLQVITGSHDKTIRMWDIRAIRPKTMATLTYHKKSVRPQVV